MTSLKKYICIGHIDINYKNPAYGIEDQIDNITYNLWDMVGGKIRGYGG